MPIAFALAAALFYGASDFLGGVASRRATTIAVVLWSQALSAVLLALAVPFFGGHAVASDVLWGALCGIAGTVALAALYRGLAIGTMGVVSPVSAVLGAAIPLLYGVAIRADRPEALAYGGIAAAFAAVVCVSASPGSRRTRGFPPGLLEALAAGTGFGAYFIALAQTRVDAGMVPLFAARVTTVVLLLIGVLAFRNTAKARISRQVVLPVLACGAFDMTANVLYVLAAHTGLLSIVAVLTSLYPAATVALAAIVLRERLGRVQWIGVALALGGAIAIAAA